MLRTLIAAALLGLAVAAAGTALGKDDRDDKGKTWAKDVPYTTDYEAAIKEARETGKMLLVYNGWEREKI